MGLMSYVALLLCMLACAASALSSSPLWHESSILRASWTPSRLEVPSSARLRFKVVLRTQHEDEILSALLAVSDPSSPSYGRHWSRAQLCEKIAPSAASVDAVGLFLRSHGLSVADASGGSCREVWTVDGTVDMVKRAFGAHMAAYSHMHHTVLATRTALRVPASISAHVALVHGLHLPVPYAAASGTPVATSQGAQASCPFLTATPGNLKSLYDIRGTPVPFPRANQTAVGWQHQSFNKGDLADFERFYGLPAQEISHIYGPNSDFAHLEANLDTQTLIGVAPGVPTAYYLNKGLLSFDVLDWLTDIGNLTQPELVWSVSYGEDESLKTPSYSQACNAYMQRLGLTGITIVIASGDSGARSRQSLGFAPSFPATCPACLAVGATIYNKNATETSAVSTPCGWSSGGGFSAPSYFANTTCPWQAKAVSRFFATAKLPPYSDYSKFVGGCDVATVGTNHDIYWYRIRQGVGGTSASCPTMAAMVSLLNNARLQQGKSPLGFVTPLVYANPQLFNDIVLGETGWFGAVGWDPLTGYGSPKFNDLLQYVLSLP